METAVDKLEALVRKAESDLNCLMCKAEVDLSSKASAGAGTQLNPLKTMQLLNELKNEYVYLTEQCDKLKNEEKETYERLQNQMEGVCKKMQLMEDKMGIDIGGNARGIFTPLPKKSSQQ